MGSSTSTIKYPSPFFDIAHTYLPTTVKDMFRWCRYYFLVNPLINAIVFKMSEYPITDIIFDTDNEPLKERWRSFIIDHLMYRGFQLEIGLDRNTYGNGFVSVFYPFVKYLKCRSCGFKKPAKDSSYVFRNHSFEWKCPSCGAHGKAEALDHYIKAPKQIRLVRWNPEDIDIRYNDITGESTYYYTIPPQIRNDVIMGRKSTVEAIPQLFIEALRTRRAIVFSKDNLFHFKRPTLAGKDRGWGTPVILPVLKDTFYLQILRKAQEAIALDHIVPLRVLFPQAGSAVSDPYSSVNLQNWQGKISAEIRRWRADPNHIPILPLPVGNQTIGGDGRALLLNQEIRVWSEQIVAGMGFPVELIFGGLSYSGSNVSLRMLENKFIGYNQEQLSMLQWIMRNIGNYLDWPTVPTRFKPFKMADDLQRKAYLFQLNQSGKLSDEALLTDADHDAAKEDELISMEAARRYSAQKKARLLQAETEGEASMISMKWQMKAQNAASKEQMSMQNEMTKDQVAFQTQAQKSMLREQTAMQQGQPPPPQDPNMMPSPRDPEALKPPSPLQSPLTAQSVNKLPPNVTGEKLVGQANADVLMMSKQIADYINGLPPASRIPALSSVRDRSPELYDVVLGLIGGGPKAAGQAARPLPEQKSSRRGPESSLV
jgi:hypothetical protein